MARRLRAVGLTVALALLASASVARADVELERASVSSSGEQGNGQSWDPAISADGRYVAFFSGSANLVPSDSNGTGDIFVRDRLTGQTTRVSVATGGGQSNGTSADPAISADGRHVAFWSRASNLVAGDTNGHDDVFLHDRETGVTTRVSVSSAGAQANRRSSDPALSGDGRFVAFTSEATTLVPVTDVRPRVYLHSLADGTTVKVSRDLRTGSEIEHAGVSPSVSGDGRHVTYAQFVDTICGLGCAFTRIHIQVLDRDTGEYERVTQGYDDSPVNGSSHTPAIGADSRWVAFASSASNLVPGDGNGTSDIFLHDRESGATSRVSVASDGAEANGASDGGLRGAAPGISADGRYIAFVSRATNLVYGDTNACGSVIDGQCPDIFVHDRVAGETTRHNVLTDGTQANGSSSRAALSADGRWLAFFTQATNLVSPDRNGWFEDVLVGGVARFAAPHPTALTAEDEMTLDGGHSVRGDLRATLVNLRTGAPVAGREVRFSAGETTVCAAETNAHGTASCAYGPEDLPALMSQREYTADFPGDGVYSPSDDRARFLALLGPGVP